MRDEPHAALHLSDDQVGNAAAIEAVRTLVRDRLKRGRELWLFQHRPRWRCLAIDQELHRAGREPVEAWRGRLQTPRSRLVDLVAPGQLDRRCDQVAPGQGSVRPVHLPEPGHRTRHSGREVTDNRALRDLAFIVQEHVAGRRTRRLLAVVQRTDFAVVRPVDQKPAAADVAGGGQDRGERKADGYGGVNSVSALFQNRGANVGGEAVAADDHAVCALSRRRSAAETPGRLSRSSFSYRLGPRAGNAEQERGDQNACNRAASERTRGNGREPAHRGRHGIKAAGYACSIPARRRPPYTGEEPCRPSSPS